MTIMIDLQWNETVERHLALQTVALLVQCQAGCLLQTILSWLGDSIGNSSGRIKSSLRVIILFVPLRLLTTRSTSLLRRSRIIIVSGCRLFDGVSLIGSFLISRHCSRGNVFGTDDSRFPICCRSCQRLIVRVVSSASGWAARAESGAVPERVALLTEPGVGAGFFWTDLMEIVCNNNIKLVLINYQIIENLIFH